MPLCLVWYGDFFMLIFLSFRIFLIINQVMKIAINFNYMRKVYVLLVVVFSFSFLAKGQKIESRFDYNFKSSVKHSKSNSKAEEIIFKEDFEDVQFGEMPKGWYVFDVDEQNPDYLYVLNMKCQKWNVQSTNSKKMSMVTSFFDPVGTSDDWMFTKKINLPNIASDEVILLRFQEYALGNDVSLNSYEVRIMENEPTKGNIETSKIIAPLKEARRGGVDVAINLSTYANKSVYIAWRDHSNDKYILGIDNIKVVKAKKVTKLAFSGFEDKNLVLSMPIVPENNSADFGVEFRNAGTEDINNFTVVCNINGADLEEQKITLTKPLKCEEHYVFNLASKLALVKEGECEIQVKVTKVNDVDLAEPLKVEKIKFTVYENNANMPNVKVLSETFTSSNIKDCNFWNWLVNTWIEKQNGNANYIKYPIKEDPYTLELCKQRLAYYQTEEKVPVQYLQGLKHEVVENMTNPTNYLTSLKSCISIKSEPKYNDKKVTVPFTLNPVITTSDFVLLVAICEKKTTGNVGTNEQKEFNNILMAMPTGATGTSLNLTKGKKIEDVLEVDMSDTHVEEMSDLIAIIFVQDSKSKQVLHSETFDIKEATVEVTGVSLSEITKKLKVGETATLTATVEPNNATNKNVTWSSSDVNIAKVDASGLVTAVAEGNANIVVKTEDGDFTDTCKVTVTKATDINDNIANNIKIYPTLVENSLVVETSQVSKTCEVWLSIYNQTGKKVKTIKLTSQKQFINVSSLQAGMYMAKIGNKVIKFVKK